MPPETSPPSNVNPEVRPTRAAWITFGLLLAAAILSVCAIYGMLWKPLFLAAVLASSLGGWHDRLTRRIRQRRALAAAIFTIGVVLLFLLPLAALTTVVVSQAIGAADFIRTTLESGGMVELIKELPQWLQGVATWIHSAITDQASDLSSRAATGFAAAGIVRLAFTTTTNFILNTILMLVAFNALLSDGPRLSAWVREISPLIGRQTSDLLAEFRTVSKSVLTSMMATAGVQAVIATVGYLIAGVPQPFFFGPLTFFAALIPVVGTALVALPLSALILFLGHPWKALFLVVWSVAVVGLVDNLVKPWLMKGGTRLHGVVVFFALLGGGLLLGPVGLIVGPLAVTFLLAMIRLGQRDFARRVPLQDHLTKPS